MAVHRRISATSITALPVESKPGGIRPGVGRGAEAHPGHPEAHPGSRAREICNEAIERGENEGMAIFPYPARAPRGEQAA